MKTLHAQHEITNGPALLSNTADMFQTLTMNHMKKLTNVSPFLLLLAPVFVMMIISFTFSNAAQEEAASKSNAKPAAAVVKVANNLLR